MGYDTVDWGEDPRAAPETIRSVAGDGDDGRVTLIGVVHDHPASVYRVRRAVATLDPAVVALELPPLAIPLYRQYAAEERTPPASGGEFAAAIQAAPGADVEGIDGPSLTFLIGLGRAIVREDVTPRTARKLLRNTRSVAREAAACRVAATRFARGLGRVRVGTPVEHDCAWGDDPRVQARDEREQFRRARAVASALEPPDAVRLRRSIREEHMADRLASIRRDADVVAVVGLGHLDPVAGLLQEER